MIVPLQEDMAIPSEKWITYYFIIFFLFANRLSFPFVSKTSLMTFMLDGQLSEFHFIYIITIGSWNNLQFSDKALTSW